MQATQTIPEGLADIPPGPVLGAVLAGIDLTAMSSFDTLIVADAEYRQLAHQQGRVYAAVAESALRAPDEDGRTMRLSEPDEFSADEIRARLVLTTRAADTLVRTAVGHRKRLAAVQAEMLAGRVDRQRGWVFTEFTAGLCQEHVDLICARLLPLCGQLTVPELIDKIKKMSIALDPGLVERRYRRGRKGRRVVGSLDPDGTAVLANYGAKPDEVAAATGRLDALARAAKNGGDPRPIDHLRSDLSIWLQDGRFEGMTDTEILAYLAANRPEPEPERPETPSPPPERPRRASILDLIRRSPRRTGPGTGTPDDPAGPGQGASEGDRTQPVADAPEQAEPEQAEPARVVSDPGGDPVAPVSGGELCGGGSPAREPMEPPRYGVELQVRFSTLVGTDEYPAELAGWGPIHPGLARSTAATLDAAQWRYVLTGPDGRLLAAGLTFARPVGARRRHCRSRAVLELQIPAALLLELATAQPSGIEPTVLETWAPVLQDIVRRIGGIDVLTGHRPYPPPDDGTEDPTRRFPRAGTRRDVHMRKRRCMGPGCRAPAGKLDLDHTIDHAHGGPTIGPNLWPACKHDHALKTKGGWTVRAIDPGTLEWTSRLGHTYVVKTPPVLDTDLPDPYPDSHAHADEEEMEAADEPRPDTDSCGTPWQQSSSWYEPPPPSPSLQNDEPANDAPWPRYIVPDDPPF